MSGNVQVIDNGEMCSGEPFDLKVEDPRDIRNTILSFLSGLGTYMAERHDKRLFGVTMSALLHGTCFAGSTQLLMSDVPKSLLMKFFGKRYFGDIDVLVDRRHIKAGCPLQEHALVRGMVHGHCIVVGSKRVGHNLHVIIQDTRTAKYRQIDFLGCEYDESDAHPTPFSRWARSSHQLDLAMGISGVYHKLMMNACIKSIGEIEGEIRDAKGKFREEGPFNLYTLSVSDGMRLAHVSDGTVIGHNGNRVNLIKRVEARHNPQYITDLSRIANLTFGTPSADISSLYALCMSLLCYTNPERQSKTLAYFKDNLSNNKELDPKAKAKAYKFANEFFNPKG